jgi:xylulokinase
MAVLLGIDIGTTNWKVAAYTGDFKEICIEKTPTQTYYDKDGNSFYRSREIWSSVCRLTKKVLAQLDDDVTAVSVTSMAEAVVPIDKGGNECFDIITWFDTRAIKESKEVERRIGRERLFSITGLDSNPVFSLCKILWVRNNHPKVYDKADKWLQMTDYIIYKLSGIIATDYSLASRTLAFDVLNSKMSDEILNEFNVSKELFPKIVDGGTCLGTVSKKANEETGLSADVKVVMGGHDHPCAALTANALGGGKVLDSSGTAESFIMVSDKDKVPVMQAKGQRVCRYLDSRRYTYWAGIISSGATFEWAYQRLTDSKFWQFEDSDYSYDDVLAQVSNVEPGANGLLFMPHLRGSGAPYWNPGMKGFLLGITSRTSPQEIMKSVLEGLSFQARMIVKMYEELTCSRINTLCVVGGSGKNQEWQQIKADITGKRIEVSEHSEATVLGAAMLAAIGAGLYKDMDSAAFNVFSDSRIYLPNGKNKKRYDSIYKVYEKSYDTIENMVLELNEISRQQ